MSARLTIATSTALACVTLAVACTGTASATVNDCDPEKYHSQSPQSLPSISTILNVRNMTCGSALRVVRKYGNTVGRSAYVRGNSFRLGSYRCSVYFVSYEQHKARCTHGQRAFRVDYGS